MQIRVTLAVLLTAVACSLADPRDDGIEESERLLKPVDAGKVLKLQGPELAKWIETIVIQYQLADRGLPQLPAGDLLRVLERAVAESKTWKINPEATDMRLSYLERLLEFAVLKSADEDVPKVSALAADCPATERQRLRLFSTQAGRLMRREIAAIRAEHPAALTIAPASEPLPENRAGSTPELREAWLRYRRVASPVWEAREAVGRPWIAYSSDAKGIAALLERVLRGESRGLEEKLALYRHGDGCFVDGEIVGAVAAARWIVLLRERRLAEAVSVSFLAGGWSGVEGVADLRREFLAVCGLDGAQLAAGRILAEFDGWNAWAGTIHANPLGDLEAELAALSRGSERDAGFVVGLLRLADLRHLDHYGRDYQEALGTILQRDASAVAPLPEPMRREAAAQLVAFLRETTRPYTLEGAIEKAGSLKLASAREALRPLLTHDAPQIPGKAAAALRALGEEVEAPVPRGPVRFRLRIDGQPLPNEYVNVRLMVARGLTGGRHEEWQAIGGVSTDATGVLSIPRTEFSGPRARFGSVRFSPVDQRSANLGNWSGGRPDASFSVDVPYPENLDAEIPVEIVTRQLTLNLATERKASFYQGKTMMIGLQRLDGTSSSPAWWSVPVAGKFVVAVQSGPYSVAVRVPGARPWKRERLEVADAPATLRVPYAPATDVSFRLAAPGGARVWSKFRVLHDGAEILSAAATNEAPAQFQLDAPGKYTLRVAASAELVGEWCRDPNELRPEEPPHAGAEVKFTVPAALPAALDLGKVVVKPIAR